MPYKPKCHKPTCGVPRRDGRPSASRRGYDAQWQRFRVSYLRLHPLCVACERNGLLTPALHVDHVVAMEKGGGKYDLSNLQGLCHSHHSVKTCAEDGGFGRKKKDAE
jgi:5-methylcytosine-specific restriction protein A